MKELSSSTPAGVRHAEVGDATPTGWVRICCAPDVRRWGLLLAAFFFAYAFSLDSLVRTWWTRDEYSHGFLIPIISAYLIWLKRSELAAQDARPAYLWGVLGVVAASSMVVVGRAAGVLLAEQVSLIVMVLSLIMLMGGRSFFKLLVFPVAYLAFMLPVADELVGPLQWPLRQLTADMAVNLLHLLGFPAFLEGQYIVLPKITLEVAQACSGASFLIAVLAIAIPLALVGLRSWTNRAILWGSAIAVALIANWVRVLLIGIGANYDYPILHGPFHILHGLVVAQVGFVYVFVAAWGLSKLPNERVRRTNHSAPLDSRSGATRRIWAGPAGWLAIGLVSVTGVVLHRYEAVAVPLRADFQAFPFAVGHWIQEPVSPAQTPLRLSGADRELIRLYEESSGRRLHVYVAYFETQSQGKEVVNDQTGHLHDQAKRITLADGSGSAISVNEGRLLAHGNEYRTVFWYHVGSRVIADRYRAKIAPLADALMRGRTQGAFVLLSEQIPPTEGAGPMTDIPQDVVRGISMALAAHLP